MVLVCRRCGNVIEIYQPTDGQRRAACDQCGAYAWAEATDTTVEEDDDEL